jgi:hypothetical protein
MPGFVMAYGTCISCKRPFSFNPMKVPSTSAITGTREPVCRSCMDAANAKRVAGGLPPHPIDPEAYEAAPEDEVF